MNAIWFVRSRKAVAVAALVAGFAGMAERAAVAGIAPPRTLLHLEVSTDNVTWTGNTNANPGQTVYFRATVTFQLGGVPGLPYGFNSMAWQPTLSNWNAGGGDILNPFLTTGNNASDGGVPNLNTPNIVPSTSTMGRILPFGATPISAGNPLTQHLETIAGVPTLRIALTSASNPIGTGLGSNNLDGAGGIPSHQLVPSVGGGTNPNPSDVLNNVVIFKAAITLGAATSVRTLTWDAPIAGIASGGILDRATWYSVFGDDGTSSVFTVVDVTRGTINVVPAPMGGALLMGLIGLGGRRRR